jgi:threonine synthase
MLYYSLNHNATRVNFAEATINGQAPDKGLYFPRSIPLLPLDFIKHLKNYSKEEIGFTIMKPFVGESIKDEALYNIIAETVNFDFPLIKINEQISSLELFHGPTLAFKDVGARFMSRCLEYFNKDNQQKITVLVATSGDTGGAVANGFLGVDGIDVVILYPSGKVSQVQELQLTTLGQNITALEVNGTFDDCQAIVKQAFADEDITQEMQLTSANSINVARWLPQQLYYFYAYQQWQHEEAPIICVPSGNFGNVCAGIVAYKSGLPVKHFIAACNVNDVIPNYFATNNYQPKAAVATVSNAMDVGNPSNFIRIQELFQQQLNDLKNKMSSMSVNDATTIQTIKEVYQQYQYILDPHGAVAFCALNDYLKKNNADGGGYILETAHPVKFSDTVEIAIQKKINIPLSVEYLFTKEKKSIKMSAAFIDFKEWLLNK